MLFSNFDPYYNDEMYHRPKPEDCFINDEMYHRPKPEDCFICYEILPFGETTIQIEDQEYYVKKCKCLGFVHKTCLDTWYNNSHKCPICREYIVKKDTIYKSFCYILPYNIYYYLLYQLGIKRITKIITTIIFLYCLLDFYYNVLNTIFNSSDYYQYELNEYQKMIRSN